MKILALDCSTEACSVALYESVAGEGEGHILAEDCLIVPREHTRQLLPMVERVLAAGQCRLAQLDAIACGRGPGSFTGLRIALGAVQGLAYGADLPVVPVSTLAALAQTGLEALRAQGQAQADTRILAAIDARMQEIYWAAYATSGALVTALGDEHLTAPQAARLPLGEHAGCWHGIGSGWHCAAQIAGAAAMQTLAAQTLPQASAVARLADREWRAGHSLAPDALAPSYLRDEVAWQKTGA